MPASLTQPYIMKCFIIICFYSIVATSIFGQTKPLLFFDTTDNNKQFNNNKYYSKTDFSIVDTLSLWNYKLDTTFKGSERDSLKPFAQIIFWRTKPVYDKKYKESWTPYIVFELYNSNDSAFCYDKSNRRRFLSSCVPPNVGGDIIFIDKFIFINSDVCLNCERDDTNVDYCRPIINYVFSKVDKTKITTLESILKQFVIKEVKLQRNENRKAINND